ncbi:MAG: hypothetical protein RLY86_1913 [Pseudomonadota bacterium]|jgi:diguanylate cyclase (GGDEF)-like protein
MGPGSNRKASRFAGLIGLLLLSSLIVHGVAAPGHAGAQEGDHTDAGPGGTRLEGSRLEVNAARWSPMAETVFQNTGRDQGLLHPVPTALAQDRDGFLWIGTQGGLARFDGYRFHPYRPDPSRPGSLPDGWIASLHVDPAGRVWIGTGAAGLFQYDRDRDLFRPVPLDAARDAAPAGREDGRQHVAAITDDGAGGLWIATDDGLRHVAADGATVTPHRAGSPTAPGLPTAPAKAVLRDQAGTLWVGTSAGLVRRPSGADSFTPVAVGETGTGITTLYQDRARRLWIGTRRRGLFRLDPDGDRTRPVGAGTPLDSASVSAIVEATGEATGEAVGEATGNGAGTVAEAGEIWAGLRGSGVAAVNPVTGAVRMVRHDRTVPFSLPNDDVWDLLRDDAGSIWVATGGGLGHHPPQADIISTIVGVTGRATGLSGLDILSVLAARDGRVWLGYLDGGVDLVDPVAGRIAALRPNGGTPDRALPPDAIFALAETAAGTTLIGSRRGLYAVVRADDPPTPGQAVGQAERMGVRLLTLPGRDPLASVTALAVDGTTLWVGGEEDGLKGYDLTGSDLTGSDLGSHDPVAPGARLVFGPAESARLADQGINVIRRGAGNDLWVGTRDGLNRIDLATGGVERFAADPDNPAALPARFVSGLLLDQRNRLWVATFGGGIAVMTGPGFRRLGPAEGLPHVNVGSLEMDGSGILWAGTDDGLARIDPESFEIRSVRRADGAALIDYMAGAGAAAPGGEVLLGSLGGLTVLRPGTLPPWTFQPPVVVTDLRVGGVPVPVGRVNGGGDGSGGGKAARPAPVLRLLPDGNSLAVEFAALDFTAPGRNRYAYRLEGYDPDWVETEAGRRLAVYTNLPPGDYVLRLRATNRDGRWSERELALPVQVLPAWYERGWFWLAATVLLAAGSAAGVAGVIRWRTAWLRHRQTVLECQIAERTADLRAMNDRLALLATTDTLTGCANRRHFLERAEETVALAGRHGMPLSLAMLDLDEFKRVNDTFGHPGGDAILAMTGRILSAHMRTTDLIGRMGGEEFALLMPHTGLDGAGALAERLRMAVAEACAVVDGVSIRVTASLGVAELRPGDCFDDLFARADAALYAAKDQGRNRVITAPPVRA